MLGRNNETTATEVTNVEQGSTGPEKKSGPLTPAYSLPKTESEVQPSFETDKKTKLRTEIDLLRGFLHNNHSIPDKTRDSILERLSKLDEHVGTSWMSSSSTDQYNHILGGTPELGGFKGGLDSIEGLIRGMEKREASGEPISDTDVKVLAENAANFVQSYPQYQKEEKDIAVKQKQNTLFNLFKKVTGVKSEDEDYSNLDEKGQAKALQKEALKHLSLFDRILLSINVNFLHKDDPTWLKDHLFKKVNIPYLAKIEILRFFYPDRDPNSLKRIEPEVEPQKVERRDAKSRGEAAVDATIPTKAIPLVAEERPRPIEALPVKIESPEDLAPKPERTKTKVEGKIQKREALKKTKTLEQLLENKTSEEKLDVFGESVLGHLSETADKVSELLVEDLQNYDTTTRLNGLTNQVNKLIYECGIIPSESEIDDVFEKIRSSREYTAEDKNRSEIVEHSIRQMIHIRTAENRLMNNWIQDAVQQSTTLKDGSEYINGDQVQDIFAQKLIDQIIDYRLNLPEGQKGKIDNQDEADKLKLEFSKSIQNQKIKVEFYQVGQINVPILMIEDYQEQAHLYGSTNPEDKDKVSPGRFFFDGKLKEDSNGEEVPSLISTVSFVTKDYLENPELLQHEILHTTYELQQHAQREIFRDNYRTRTLKSNLVGESVIKFILSGDTETQINSLNESGVEIPKSTLLLIQEIKKNASDEDIHYFISGGYEEVEDGKYKKQEAKSETVEKTKGIRDMIKESPYTPQGGELKDVGAKDVSADLIQKYIETGTSGVPEFDTFIKENYQINNHVVKVGEIYNRFYNPVNEAVTTYVTSERNVSLGDLKITNFSKDNPELIGGIALIRLLNEHSKTGMDLVNNGQIEQFLREKELLAKYLNSSPLYKNGRVTIGSMMELLNNSLENEEDPIHDLLNIIVPGHEEEIDQEYLEKLKKTIPVLKGWLGEKEPTPEQYRLLCFLFPNELIENFDDVIEKESTINEEDSGIGKATNPDPLLRHAVNQVYTASEYGTTNPNKRSGQSYGGKLDIFYKPFMPKDPGSPLLQFWGWNSKTFTDGFGLGSSKKFRLDSIDPLEAIAFATGIPVHRLPFLENLREKKMTKDAYYPETYVSPSPKAYTAGVFKSIFSSIQAYGRLDDMSAITLMTKIGGYHFNLQGQPTLSNETWVKEDEYRNNDALADFIRADVPGVESKLRRDVIEVGGQDIDVEKFKVGQMSKGYLTDILESMVMGKYPDFGKKPKNAWGHEMMGFESKLKDMDNNMRKRKAFERIGKIMMAADYAKNQQTVTNPDGSASSVYAGDHSYTLFDLYEAINTAQLTLPGKLMKVDKTTGKIVPDTQMENIYQKQSFTINIGGTNVGEGITGEDDNGAISLKDAKEFLEFAIIARAEKVVSVGVWGKAMEKDQTFEKIPLPKDEKGLMAFITTNGYEPVDERHLRRGNELFEIETDAISGVSSLCRVSEKYSKTAEIKTGAKVYGNYDLKTKPIENFTPDQMDFFFGEKKQYTTTDENGATITLNAREEYALNKGLIYDSVFDELTKINMGKKLSFQYSMKLMQTDRYREYSKAQMELWNGLRNIDNFYRFVIIAASAVGALVPGMAFLANPGLFVGLMAWSLVGSPLIDRQANAWSARMLAAIDAQTEILGYSDRFYGLANEDHPPSFGDLDLARTQMETVKYKWRTVLTNMSKNAKWDTNIFTNLFNQMWGKVT